MFCRKVDNHSVE